MEKVLHIYLHSPRREMAAQGKVNLFRRMQAALPDWQFSYHPDTEDERARAPDRGFGLFHMQPPNGPQILCLRKTYVVPFWRIEATTERWEFDVTKTAFDPAGIPAQEARGFLNRWRPKILGDEPVTRDGFVLVPLQGRISEQRSFQSASPLEMLETIVERIPDKPIIVTLHPKETYTPADMAALERIEARFSRVQVHPPSPKLLMGCDAVVTQNSSVALHGYFAQKPAVLFAGSDLHHIAGSVWRDDVETAFAQLAGPEPDFARYLCWFFRRQSINCGAPDCEAQIVARLRQHGWPV